MNEIVIEMREEEKKEGSLMRTLFVDDRMKAKIIGKVMN